MVVAAHSSVFVMAYSNVGLSPDGGATWSLMRALPRATALQLLMCGDRIGAERLQQLGVINTVSATGEALVDALALCERLNARAPNALASIKELANDAPTVLLHAQLGAERDHFVRNLHHANAGEGIDAFINKRPANYR
ncbi:1,2-epoxyphenylacetyl-CoA isomerase [compost metagenome]